MSYFLGSIEMSSAVTEYQPINGDWTIICGDCGVSVKHHPINNDFLVCSREQDSFPNHYNDNNLGRSDYYYNTVTKEMYLISDYSGYPETEEDADEYVSVDNELSALENWRDVTHDAYAKTWVGTVTLEQHQTGLATEALIDAKGTATPYSKDAEVTNEDRTVYVEGQDGFIARNFLNDLLTRKYHARLLNVFTDKRTGDLRIGGIRIIKGIEGRVIGRCVNGNCRAELTIDTQTATRTDYEDFILSVIRHGNNHAADWFRSRDTYYKVHAAGCDIHACDPNVPWCKVIVAPSPVGVVKDVTEMFDHQTYCKNSKCSCANWLANEVPALVG